MTTRLADFDWADRFDVTCRVCDRERSIPADRVRRALKPATLVHDGVRYRLPFRCACGASDYDLRVPVPERKSPPPLFLPKNRQQ